MEILRVENLTKIYGTGPNAVCALDHVSFSIQKGEVVAITGPSGSGKSTLLHLLGCVDRPSEGKVWVNRRDIYAQNEEKLAVFRRRQVGLICGTRSLLWGLSAAFVLTYLMWALVDSSVGSHFYLPWTSVLIAIDGVFLIVFVTMFYSVGKLRKENPIETIRNENI